MINEAERLLIGAWLLGKHTQHVGEFDKFEHYNDILHAIKKYGADDPVLIAGRTSRSVAEIMDIVGGCMLSMYDGAYKTIKREKIKKLTQAAAKDDVKRAEILAQIQDEIKSMSAVDVPEPVNLAQAFREDFERRKTEEVMPYGVADLDYYMGGLRRKELTVFAGRPSLGKTALALQIAYRLSSYRNRKVMFFSLEMAASQIVERLICMETDIPHEQLKKPKMMRDEHLAAMNEYLDSQEFGNLLLFDGVRNLSTIEKVIEERKPDIIFVDQLSHLREVQKFYSVRERFTYMTNTLKALSMIYDISIVLMAQIRRDAQNREPTLADLKESGSIEEDADNVVMIHQPEEVDRRMVADIPMTLLIRKQRNGMKDISCPVIYQGKKFMFRSESDDIVDGFHRL